MFLFSYITHANIDVAQIRPPKKYKVVAKSNTEPNKVEIDPIGNKSKFDQVFV